MSPESIGRPAPWEPHLVGSASRALAAADVLAAGSIPDLIDSQHVRASEATICIASVVRPLPELARDVARRRTAFADAGIQQGDRVALVGDTSFAFLESFLALLAVGAVVVLVSGSSSQPEVHRAVSATRAVTVVTHSPMHAGAGMTIDPVTQQLPDEPVEATRAVAASSDLAVIASTSGSTGLPKFVPLTHGNLLASVRAAALAWGWSRHDHLVHCLPLGHQHGLSSLLLTLASGSSLTVMPRFEPTSLLESVSAQSATVMFGIPTHYRRLLTLPDEDVRQLRRLRLATCGSAPLPPDVGQELESRTGIRLLQRYGLTESGLNLSNPVHGDRRYDSIGFPLPGVDVILAGPDGTQVEPGAEGEICLRGPQVFGGYLNDAHGTEAAFTPSGYFRTGDLGLRSSDGRYTITGRVKDIIISGGLNIAPAEIERHLIEHPAVAHAAVRGVPSVDWGEAIVAWVVRVAGSPLTDEDLRTHCRTYLSSHKIPKQFIFVDDLPLNDMGKLRRDALVLPTDGESE